MKNKFDLSLLSLVLAMNCGEAAHGRAPRVALVLDGQTQKTVWLEVANGAKLAVKEMGASGKKVIFEVVDSGTTAVGTRTEMIKLAKSPPDIVVAEIDSSKAAVAAEIAESSHVVMITPFATSPRVVEGRKFVFRACVADDVIANRLAHYSVSSRKAKQVAIINDGGQLYSVTLKDAFKKAFESEGGKIVFEGSILSTSNSYEQLVTQLVNSKPDLVFLPFYEETVGRFLAQAVKVQGFSKLELLGSDGWADAAFFKSGSANNLEGLKATWVTHHDPNLSSTPARAFSDAFKKEFGKRPETSAAFLGYDAMKMSLDTLLSLSDPPTPENIVRALHNRKPYSGATGEISFSNGNEPNKALFLIRHENSAIKTIGGLPQ